MTKTRNNVLLITADQLRKDALGCYGNTAARTPCIDALSAGGMCFDNIFTASPVCAPNRASLTTGRYPSVHGLRENGMILPHDELTLMQVLRRHGYRTYGTGKMHFEPQWRRPEGGGNLVNPGPEMAIDPQPPSHAMPWYGFDEVCLSEDNRVGPYADYLAEHGYDVWDDPHSFTYPQHITKASAYPEEHYQSTWIADRAIDQLASHPDAHPFFMWVSFVDPHHPFTPPAPYDSMFDPADMPLPLFAPEEVDRWPSCYKDKYYATEGSHEAIGMCHMTDDEWQRITAYYYGMVSLIDKQVGRLVRALADRGLEENTLIVFTSDHGEMLGDHHLVFKGTSYDCVTNVPLIVTSPDLSLGSCSSKALGSSIDLMPTVLDLLGLPIPNTVQGQSLKPAIVDPQTILRDAVLIEHTDMRRTIRTGTSMLTWHGRDTVGELYDLRSDPSCVNNLWCDTAYDSLKLTLLEHLLHLMAANKDPAQQKLGAC